MTTPTQSLSLQPQLDEGLLLPPGYRARPMQVEDAAAIVDVLNRNALALVAEPNFSVAEYESDLRDPALNLNAQTRLVLGPEGDIAALVEVHERAPWDRPFLWVQTADAHRDRGLGGLLLAWGEAYARSQIHRAPPDARFALGATSIDRNVAAAALLDAAGFNHVRTFWHMRIELQQPPAVRWPSGVTARPLRPGLDEERLFRVYDETFSDHWGHVVRPFDEAYPRFVQQLHDDPMFDPSLIFLAWVGDEVAGFVQSLPTVPGELEMGWIQRLGVRRPWRKQGLALALLQHTLGAFLARGVSLVGLGVDSENLTGATRIYEKVGFWTHHASFAWDKELRPGVELGTRTLDDTAA